MTGQNVRDGRGRTRRATLWCLLIVGSLIASACSGGGSDTGSTESTSAPAPSGSSGESSSSTSTEQETTTTAPPPVLQPVGERWEETILLDNAPSSRINDIVEVGGAVWALGNRANGPLSFRSLDGGDTWENISIAAPPGPSGGLSVISMVEGPGGQHLAFGSRASQCQQPNDLGEGYTFVGICERFRPVIYLSDDGVTWRVVEPPSMANEGNTSVILSAVAATPDGYVAVGTIRGADWFGRIWTSPDGENWSVARDVRGDGQPMSIVQAVHDGEQLVVLANEHPCSVPTYNTPGWILGGSWASHMRILSGTSVDDLRLLGAGEHPLAVPPLVVDCSISRGEDIADEPYPAARLDMVGGQIVMVDTTEIAENDLDDEEAAVAGVRTLVTLTKGAWETKVIEDVPLRAPIQGTSDLVAVDGGVGVVEWQAESRTLFQLDTLLASGEGTSVNRPATRPVVASSLTVVASAQGSLFAGGSRVRDPFSNLRAFSDPMAVVVFRSVEREVTVGETECIPAAGQRCHFADFTMLPDYPELAGIDLSGADLSFANLGAADLSGANFSGAVLWGVTGGSASEHVLLAGANFTGADLRDADIVDAAGADFTNADLRSATIRFTAAPASLAGSLLADVRLEAVGLGSDRPEIEISLTGLDLTDANVRGHITGPLLVITDLRGAILTDALFYAVDFSATLFDDLATLDLTTFDVWDNSICPDGLPPTDSGISNCARS